MKRFFDNSCFLQHQLEEFTMQTGELDLQFAFISATLLTKWQTILVLRIDPTLKCSLACCFVINQTSSF
jgi:hypothetical protein